MSDVFISYKREDEARVARLAKALESAGFDVWWDRGLPGGESWRANIEAALESARCVVAVWSKASVAKEGHFVRDEAGRAMARRQLVPVFIDRVDLPLGFGEVQAIDLSGWRGRPNDPAIHDVVEACKAKLDDRPAPPANLARSADAEILPTSGSAMPSCQRIKVPATYRRSRLRIRSGLLRLVH